MPADFHKPIHYVVHGKRPASGKEPKQNRAVKPPSDAARNLENRLDYKLKQYYFPVPAHEYAVKHSRSEKKSPDTQNRMSGDGKRM